MARLCGTHGSRHGIPHTLPLRPGNKMIQGMEGKGRGQGTALQKQHLNGRGQQAKGGGQPGRTAARHLLSSGFE